MATPRGTQDLDLSGAVTSACHAGTCVGQSCLVKKTCPQGVDTAGRSACATFRFESRLRI